MLVSLRLSDKMLEESVEGCASILKFHIGMK